MDRIEHDEYLKYAENLAVGQSVRAKHCNNNRTMIVSRDENFISAYCFRCGGRGYKQEQESLADRIGRIAREHSADAEARASLDLPEPRVYALNEWPRSAALWLYRSGFSPSMIERLGAYWCPSLGRVVLPIMEDDRVVFWQARSVRRKPKIIAPRLPRQGVVAKYGRGDTLVLCEDILSAAKVGQVTEAWSLLGTKMLPDILTKILDSNKPVIVWLDGDEAGQTGATKIQRALRAYGVVVRNIVTPKDPKMYSRAYIEELLCR